MRILILFLLVSSCFAISLDDESSNWIPSYSPQYVKEAISKSREALIWLAMNSDFDRRVEWQKKIAVTELIILSDILRDIARYHDDPEAKKLEPIVMARFEEICPLAFMDGEPIINLMQDTISKKMLYKYLWIEVTEKDLEIGRITLEWAEEILKQKKLREEM